MKQSKGISAVQAIVLLIGCTGILIPTRRLTSIGPKTARKIEFLDRSGLTDPLLAFGDALRSQLARLQREEGLTLVSVFDTHLYTVDFATRSLKLSREHQIRGSSQVGVVSPDGSEVAFMNCIKDRASDPSMQSDCDDKTRNLGISKLDGSSLRVYPELSFPYGMCWSDDKAKLALTASGVSGTPTLQIIELGSGDKTNVDDENSFTMPQCWSPDGTLLVYTKNGEEGKQTLFTYNSQTKRKKELASGGYATWIPNSDWISFLDCGVELHDCTYYAIRSDGTGKKALFKTFAATTGLSWSPDGRFAAYVSAGRPSEPPQVSWRLRVRSRQDNAEDWGTNLTDTDPTVFQWTKSPL